MRGTRGSWRPIGAALGAFALLLSACGGESDAENGAVADAGADEATDDEATDGADETQETVRVAWLTATASAGYPAGMLEHAREAAPEHGVDLQVFDAQFDPQQQLAQCQDVIAQDTFDAIVVLPAASPVMVPCAEEAAAAGIPLIATNTPIGSDFSSGEPTVDGVTSQVLKPATQIWDAGAEAMIDACAEFETCYVGVLLINRALALSTIQEDILQAAAAEHDNIEIVGVTEGNAQRQGGLEATQDFLQRQPDLSVIVSGSDDMAIGAQQALEEAGQVVSEDVLIVTEGSSYVGIERLRAGAWFATTQSNAHTEGAIPIELAARAARGESIPSYVDSSDASGLPQILTPEVLQEHPDFEGTFDA